MRPFIYFDLASTFGLNDSIANITLEAVRFMPGEEQTLPDRVVVAHLRMSFAGLRSLKAAIEGIEQTAASPKPPTETAH